MRRVGLALAVALVALAATPPRAGEAAFPGENGRLAIGLRTLQSHRVIALIAADGGQERILTRGEAPRWSPAGGRLLYAREAAGEIAVFHAAPDGSARQRVRLGPVRRYEKGPFLLRWSQTGRRLVYLRASDGIEPRTAIFSARRDGSHQQLIRRFPPNAEVALAVSPESGEVAFTERRGSRFLLRLMRANGTRVRTILTRPLSAEHVAPPAQLDYSPDGRQIAFDGDGIRAVNVDGTAVRRLHPHGGHPAWSPDGRQLAFVVIRHQPGDGLQLMNADGTDQRTIREGFDVESVDWQPVMSGSASRSPPASSARWPSSASVRAAGRSSCRGGGSHWRCCSAPSGCCSASGPTSRMRRTGCRSAPRCASSPRPPR